MITLNDFSLFDPQTMGSSALPDEPGNLIVVLRSTSSLPAHEKITSTPILTPFEYKGEKYDVVFVGKSGTSLRTRVYEQHYEGTGGISTLRKSLGCLLGFDLIPQDVNSPNNGKTTFDDEDEYELTRWMKENLLLFYFANNDYSNVAKELTRTYNPPLNLQGNFYKTNLEYRKELSALRTGKPAAHDKPVNKLSKTSLASQQVRCRHCGRKLEPENLKSDKFYVCPDCGSSTQNPTYQPDDKIKPVKKKKWHSTLIKALIGLVIVGAVFKCYADWYDEYGEEDRIGKTENTCVKRTKPTHKTET